MDKGAWTREACSKHGAWIAPAVIVVFLAGLLSGLNLRSAPTARAATYPPVTHSSYESSASATSLYNQGKTDGQAGNSGVVILDFGRPAYNSATGSYGTFDFGNHFDSYSKILTALESYADAFFTYGGTTTAIIALGTNNNCTKDTPCCVTPCSYTAPNLSTAGDLLAARVIDLENYILNHPPYSTYESASSADDAEPAWDAEYSDTSNLLAAYSAHSGSRILWDYGSMEPGYWTNSQAYYVAYGAADDLPFPEVYHTNPTGMANDWENLDLWAHSNSLAFYVSGVTNDYHSGTSCTLTPHQAYDDMLSALQSHASTSQPSINYLTKLPC